MATRNPLIPSLTLHSEEYQMRLVRFQRQGHPVWLRKSDSKQVIVSIAGVFDGLRQGSESVDKGLQYSGGGALLGAPGRS